MLTSEKYQLIPHTADRAVRIYGESLQELFSNALIALFETAKPIKASEEIVHHSVQLHAESPELLLVDFLSECVYFSDANHQAYDKVIFHSFTDKTLTAVISGYPILGFEESEVKAVTYHALNLQQNKNGWEATVVFDI